MYRYGYWPFGVLINFPKRRTPTSILLSKGSKYGLYSNVSWHGTVLICTRTALFTKQIRLILSYCEWSLFPLYVVCFLLCDIFNKRVICFVYNLLLLVKNLCNLGHDDWIIWVPFDWNSTFLPFACQNDEHQRSNYLPSVTNLYALSCRIQEFSG